MAPARVVIVGVTFVTVRFVIVLLLLLLLLQLADVVDMGRYFRIGMATSTRRERCTVQQVKLIFLSDSLL